MLYQIAERFKSIQGEGVYAGTPMAFIRFVGCSVGKRICNHCDTDFETQLLWRGGGEFTSEQLLEWAGNYEHICLTGGEPLDQNLEPLLATARGKMFHIETSGTKPIPSVKTQDIGDNQLWVCVSPKPGYLEEVVRSAHEVKVIVPGLSGSKEWPTITDAKRWVAAGKIVFLQPRNGKNDVDRVNLMYVKDLIAEHPQFRLSVQMHKILKVQ